MISEINVKVEDKVKQLQNDLNNQSSYLSNINDAIKKLINDRKTTQANIHMINGAIQAYNETSRVLKEADGITVENEAPKDN